MILMRRLYVKHVNIVNLQKQSKFEFKFIQEDV